MTKQTFIISCTFQWCWYHGKTSCEYNVNPFGPGGAHMHQQKSVIGSDNGVLSERHQAIIWTNTGMLFIWTQEQPYQNSEAKIQQCSYNKDTKNAICKFAAILYRPQCTNRCQGTENIQSLNYELTYWAMTRMTLPVFHECFKVC